MSFEPLRNILSKNINLSPTKATIQIARVFDVFKTVTGKLWGEERAAYVHPVSFKDGVLKIEASAPAAAQQLQVDRVRLLNETNRILGARVVVGLSVQRKGF